MDITPIHAAVIGCGSISDIYLSNLTQKFKAIKVVACNDHNQDKMDAKAEKYHIKALLFDDILGDPTIKMIINLTNPKSHYEVIKAAIEHGKHVFSEKMIAVTLKEGQELCDLATEHHVRLGVAPDTFLGGSIQTAGYILKNNLIGTPQSVVVSLERNFNIFGDIFPHLNQKGGTMPFDTGCYYLQALASLLGPATRVSAFSTRYRPDRVSARVDKPWFGQTIKVEDDNVMTAIIEYDSGELCTVHFNSESIINERKHMEIYGSDGILTMGDPNEFGSPVFLEKPMSETAEFPLTHGFQENSRGVGAAEMAWSILKNRPQRASMEMAYHVFELIHGMYISSTTGNPYQLQSTFDKPDLLPEGFIGNGFWGPTEESALV